VIDIFLVFVTGNANKLREVKEILAPYNIEIEARSLDGVLSDDISASTHALITPQSVPEVQGTTQEVAIAKCRAAAEIVSVRGDPRTTDCPRLRSAVHA
jgi:inosine triphosphate pyrophosphatase